MAVIFGRVIGRERDCRGEGVSRQVCVLYQRVGFTYLELLISGQDHLLLAHPRQSAPGSCHRYSTVAPRFPRSVLLVSAATDVDQIEAVPNRMMRRSPPPILVVQGSLSKFAKFSKIVVIVVAPRNIFLCHKAVKVVKLVGGGRWPREDRVTRG